MAYGAVALEPGDLGLIGEDLGEKTQTPVAAQPSVVVRHNPGALLTPVLQGVESEIRQTSRIGMPPYAENPAFLMDILEFSRQP